MTHANGAEDLVQHERYGKRRATQKLRGGGGRQVNSYREMINAS